MNAQSGNSGTIDKKLQSEIYNLIHYIDRLRKEIAGIAQEKNSQTRFEGMADRLDAIMGSTAEATDLIVTRGRKSVKRLTRQGERLVKCTR